MHSGETNTAGLGSAEADMGTVGTGTAGAGPVEGGVVEVKILQSPAQNRRYARKVWGVLVSNQQVLCIVLPLLVLLFRFTPGSLGEELRNAPLLCGILMGVSGLALVQLILHYRQIMNAWAQWATHPSIFRLSESQFEYLWRNAVISYSWESLSTLWRRPDIWLVYEGNTLVIFLPAEQLTDEFKKFMLHRLEEAGGTIIPALRPGE